METSQTQTNAGRVGAKGASARTEVAGKYMTFKLATEEYGVEILHVREIIGLMDITRVPRTADYVRGVINLRGKVIPVVDLRLKFGMERIEPTEQTVIIVVQHQLGDQSVTTGLLVDEVLEVLNVENGMMEPPPIFGGDAGDGAFLVGVGKVGPRMVFLLDIERVLQGGSPVERPA
jgi:purine-binding chemotaxis protein CheW